MFPGPDLKSCSFLSSCIFLAVAFSLVSNQRSQKKKVEKWSVLFPSFYRVVLAGTSAHFCQLMSFFPFVVTSTHHFRCLCWTLKLQLVDTAMAAVIENSGYVCQLSKNKVSVFLQIQPSSSSPNHSPKSECRGGCLQEPLPLLRASETRSFPWYPALVSFFKLLSTFWSWLLSFLFSSPSHFFLSFFFCTLSWPSYPRGQLFLLSFFFCQQLSEYTTCALEKNQYLLKCIENSSCL